MKLNRLFYTMCCMTLAATPVMAQQQDSTVVKNKYFDAKDYVLQKRYIPKGRPFYKDAKGKNLSFGLFGGISKLQGAGSWESRMGEFGISAAMDVNSFHTFRASFLSGVNGTHAKMGLEIDHIFRIQDYVAGWKENRRFYVETVWGIGGYAAKPRKDNFDFAFGVHGGVILSRRLSENLTFYLEPRLNLYTDGIDGREIPRNYDLGFQGLVGLTYRLQSFPYNPIPNMDPLDNYFYEIYAGTSGDFSQRVWSNLKMKTLGPTAGISIGKWLYPLGFRGTLFGGWRYTPNAVYTDKSEEPYMGLRIEALINMNTFFDSNVTDPKFEVNLAGGYQIGYLAHKGDGVYKKKIRMFNGPTLALQTVYFVRPDVGIFAQARWTGDKYSQNFVEGPNEKRHMRNIGLEIGVQYRRRYEKIENKKGKYKFEPYNWVAAQIGTNFPLHTAGLNADNFVNELGQQFSLSYGRRYSPIAAVRGTLEAARYGYSKDKGAYPLTIGADFMLDAIAIAGGYNPERIVSVFPFLGLLFTHNEAGDKNNFGVQGGADVMFKMNDKWGLYMQGALRMYKGQITPGAREYTTAKFSFVPNISAGVAYNF